MSSLDYYGPIDSAKTVADAIEATMRLWTPQYIAEVSYRDGKTRDALPAFASYNRRSRDDRRPETHLPSVVIAVGQSSKVTRNTSEYAIAHNVTIGLYNSADSETNAVNNGYLYTAATEAALVQHGSLGGKVSSLRLLSHRFDDVVIEQSRTLMHSAISLEIDMLAVFDDSSGPRSPLANPLAANPGAWPQVQRTNVNLTQEP